MLEIEVKAQELWDEEQEEFLYTKPATLRLEHSLISVSKWESKWRKPFLTKTEKTVEESLDYIRCMTLNIQVNNEIYYAISNEQMKLVTDYIDAPMTATTFSQLHNKQSSSAEQITSELIYYWMIALNIPMECQKWHLNRLLTLIRVCEVKNSPPEKMSMTDIMRRNAELNAKRKKQYNTKG